MKTDDTMSEEAQIKFKKSLERFKNLRENEFVTIRIESNSRGYLAKYSYLYGVVSCDKLIVGVDEHHV